MSCPGLPASRRPSSLEQHALDLTDLRLRGGFTWGIQGARFFTPHWGAEIVFTQQASALEAVTPAGSADLYRITLAQLQANAVYQFGDDDAQWRPFVFGGAGATFFAARDLESATKASFGLGGGIKYFPWKTIGLRGQFRYKPTLAQRRSRRGALRAVRLLPGDTCVRSRSPPA